MTVADNEFTLVSVNRVNRYLMITGDEVYLGEDDSSVQRAKDILDKGQAEFGYYSAIVEWLVVHT